MVNQRLTAADFQGSPHYVTNLPLHRPSLNTRVGRSCSQRFAKKDNATTLKIQETASEMSTLFIDRCQYFCLEPKTALDVGTRISGGPLSVPLPSHQAWM